MSLRDFLGVARRNAWLLALGAVVTATPIAYVVLQQPPAYRAEALIRLVDARGAMTGTAGMADEVIGLKSDAILSEIEVMRGRNVIGQVVDREGLRLQPETAAFPIGLLREVEVAASVEPVELELTFAGAEVSLRSGPLRTTVPYGQPVAMGGVRFIVAEPPAIEAATLRVLAREEAIDLALEKLETVPRDRTDAVTIGFTAADPLTAQRVTNAIVAVHQAANAEAAQEQSRRRRVFLETQLAVTDSLLTAAEGRLGTFRIDQQLYSSRERAVTQQQSLLDIDLRREELAAEHQMYTELLAQLDRGEVSGRSSALRTLVSAPGLASNSVITGFYDQLTEYESERDARTTGPQAATAEHPDVIRLDGLIASTQVQLLDAIRSHVTSVEAQIAAYASLSDRTAGEMSNLPRTEIDEGRLLQQAEAVRRVSDQLTADLQRARMAEAVEVGQVQVVHGAPLPLDPNGSGIVWKVGLGLVLGILLGSGGAMLRESSNTSIRQAEDLEVGLGLPRLAVVPRAASAARARGRIAAPHRTASAKISRDAKPDLAMLQGTTAAGAEAYRMLRTNLLYSQASRGLSTVVVTSPAPGEGKTTTVANLAIAFAQQGQRVLLVDCDLRRPRLHQVFNLPAGLGLSELLRGTATLAEAIRPSGVDDLTLLTCGAIPDNPAELLGGHRMEELVKVLADGFDLVLLDSPPVLAAAEAMSLSTFVDGVVLVVKAGQTDRDEARLALRQLGDVGADVLGAVLNDPDATTPRYGGYGHYKYYQSYAATT